MSRRKAIGLSAIGPLTAVVVVMFVIGRIDLTDFITQLAVGLTLLIPVLAYFMFKPEIEKWIRSRKTSVSTTFSSVTKQEQQGTSTVSQVIGNPNSIENGIQHYNTRDELPRFGELLGLAHKK
jgi:hypothetical protein